MSDRLECPGCEGSGWQEFTCGDCNGSGEGSYDGSTCSSCKGQGAVTDICEDCNGDGLIDEEEYNDED